MPPNQRDNPWADIRNQESEEDNIQERNKKSQQLFGKSGHTREFQERNFKRWIKWNKIEYLPYLIYQGIFTVQFKSFRMI